MAFQKLERTWTHLRCSSSVSNFKDKALLKFNLVEWKPRHFTKPTLFFGMYHIGDYLRFLFHRGKKEIFWCGSDIKNLTRLKAKMFRCRSICENWVEYKQLLALGINADIHPVFLENTGKFRLSFKPFQTPHVYLCSHKGRNYEYGVELIESIAHKVPEVTFHIYGVWGTNKKNIVYHGQVSNDQFNQEIKNYQGALRLNEFDGFSEVLAKSILMGQYPISVIRYPHVIYADSEGMLVHLLKSLKKYKKPNEEARDYWLKIL